jgi:[ribosomal protein S5]-alanine N-acetyltransferase
MDACDTRPSELNGSAKEAAFGGSTDWRGSTPLSFVAVLDPKPKKTTVSSPPIICWFSAPKSVSVGLMWLETDRLLLRRPCLSDAAGLQSILGDDDAMRYTRRLATLRECRRYIAGHECQRRKLGYGPWLVVEKASREIIGFGGLYDDPFEVGWGIEIGYQFAKTAWGNGYATELTEFCLQLAHERLGFAEVRAFAHPDNAASQRVLTKTSFERQRSYLR